MVKHMVAFKLKEPTRENIDAVKGIIMSMLGEIDVVRSLRVEEDFLRAPESFDLMLFAEFDNRDDLMTYAMHPYHLEFVGAKCAPYVTAVHPFDYED